MIQEFEYTNYAYTSIAFHLVPLLLVDCAPSSVHQSTALSLNPKAQCPTTPPLSCQIIRPLPKNKPDRRHSECPIRETLGQRATRSYNTVCFTSLRQPCHADVCKDSRRTEIETLGEAVNTNPAAPTSIALASSRSYPEHNHSCIFPPSHKHLSMRRPEP